MFHFLLFLHMSAVHNYHAIYNSDYVGSLAESSDTVLKEYILMIT
jgi:hypothetical protein